MLAAQKLPASLSGIESINFFQYWNAIKDKIGELQGLGYQISLYQQKLGVAKSNLIAKGRKDLADLLNDEIKKVQDDLDKWWKVKGYIDKYLPEWMKAAQGGTVISKPTVNPVAVKTKQGVSYQTYQPKTTVQELTSWVKSWVGLEALPVMLGVAAITALAYVVTTGMALLADYQYRKNVTADVIEGKLTGGTAAELLRVTSPGEGLLTRMGLGVGVALPIIVMIGAVIYFGMGERK